MLYDILINRPAVNILKHLSEKDKKKKYTADAKDIARQYKGSKDALKLLSEHGLVYAEDDLISISEKGKKFIEIFDQLTGLFRQKEEKRETNVEIHYEISDFEKKLLFMLLRLQQENRQPVSLTQISRELFPYEDYERKKSRISRHINRLEQLNLVRKLKQQREVRMEITETGTKVVKRQLVNEISRIV